MFSKIISRSSINIVQKRLYSTVMTTTYESFLKLGQFERSLLIHRIESHIGKIVKNNPKYESNYVLNEMYNDLYETKMILVNNYNNTSMNVDYNINNGYSEQRYTTFTL